MPLCFVLLGVACTLCRLAVGSRTDSSYKPTAKLPTSCMVSTVLVTPCPTITPSDHLQSILCCLECYVCLLSIFPAGTVGSPCLPCSHSNALGPSIFLAPSRYSTMFADGPEGGLYDTTSGPLLPMQHLPLAKPWKI